MGRPKVYGTVEEKRKANLLSVKNNHANKVASGYVRISLWLPEESLQKLDEQLVVGGNFATRGDAISSLIDGC